MASALAIVGLVFGSLLAGLAIVFRLINSGRAEQRAADQEKAIQNEIIVDQKIKDALDGDARVRTDIANGKLREDDGYKRKS